MTKEKILWCCSECGHSQLTWSGQCSACLRWNVLQKEKEISLSESRYTASDLSKTKPIALDQVTLDTEQRMHSKVDSFDRLLGGGLIRGSLCLIGGDPGIGKSTLILQVVSSYANQGYKVLYICGEESVAQVSLRAKRLNITSNNLFLLAQTQLNLIKEQIEKVKPDIVIVDSIQVVYKSDLPSMPGSVSQVREVTTELMYLAKSINTSMFIIGHVTKSGEIAGPRVLEHLVDTVFYFEGDKEHHYRILRSIKNRFGSTDEIAIYQMKSSGLEEIENPSEIFLEERKQHSHGSVIVPIVEGSCPILVEAQALVTSLAYSAPSRKAMGIDQNRLALLLAVLEKKVGYQLMRHDVFVALAGGLKVSEPALDLAILIAVASSYLEKKIDPKLVVIGEVGLGGNVRRVSKIEKRLKEASRMGFENCILPKSNLKGLSKELLKTINVYPVEYVNEAIKYCFNKQ